MAKELAEFGVINLGPLCDLNAGNSVITGLSRAFHSDPKSALNYCLLLLMVCVPMTCLASGKHFPGHG